MPEAVVQCIEVTVIFAPAQSIVGVGLQMSASSARYNCCWTRWLRGGSISPNRRPSANRRSSTSARSCRITTPRPMRIEGRGGRRRGKLDAARHGDKMRMQLTNAHHHRLPSSRAAYRSLLVCAQLLACVSALRPCSEVHAGAERSLLSVFLLVRTWSTGIPRPGEHGSEHQGEVATF